jgi:glycosyltransferase involved in cell wall biosynthesis
LLICGPLEPTEDDYLRTVKSIIKNAGVENRVIWTGPLHGELRFNAFSAASLFVLPSYSENFGIVVLEALSSGLPVITTTGTPWEEVVDYGAGWQIDINSKELRSALLESFSLSTKERKLKGEKGKILAQKYCWSLQAKKMLALYKSVSAA